MKKKLSYTDIAILHLHARRGEWIAGFSLSKANLDGGFVGPSCERRLRETSAVGYHIIKGIKYFIEERMNRGYIEYRCPNAEQSITIPIFNEKERSVRLEKKVMNL